jgi:hypothetical protein
MRRNIKMKLNGLFTIAAALVVVLGATHVVKAQAYPVLDTYDINSTSSGPFTFIVNNNTDTFTFSDPNVVFYSIVNGSGTYNPGPVSVSGAGTIDGAGDVLSGSLDFTGSGGWSLIPHLTLNSGTFNDYNNQEGGYAGPTRSGADLDLFSGFYELNIAGSKAHGTFTNSGGIESATYGIVGGYWVPAPETGTLVAFGAMLGAGGLLLFARKRRSSAEIA